MPATRFTFDGFEADLIKRLLLKEGVPVPLNSRTFDLLTVFLENRGMILTKNELLDSVWAGQFVEESNLPVHISALRKALREKKDEHRFIVTVPGKGYRFVAPVEEVEAPAGRELKTDEGRVRPGLKFAAIFAVLLIGAVAAAVLFSGTTPVTRLATLNRLTTSGKVTAATITPDGRYIVFSQKEENGESLYLRQAATGSQTRIQGPEQVEFVGLSVSPDNNFIYYSLFRDNQADGYLSRIPLTGGAATEISPIETGVSVSFSPDGKQIVYTRRSSAQGASYVLKANVDGSGEIKLATAAAESRAFESFKVNPVAWSPQGDDIAAAIVEERDGQRRSGIELIDAESGAEQTLVAPTFAFLDHLAWIDNDRLAFVGYENDEWSSQVYTVTRGTGEIRKLTNDLQTYSWLGYAQGILVTVQRNTASSLNVMSLDPNLASPEPRELISENGTMWAAFAPDGSILYTSMASGKREIWRVAGNGAGPEQLTTDVSVTYGLTASPADGSIVFCSNKKGRHSLWMADSAGRNVRQLTDQDDIAPQFSADGRTVVFQRGLNAISAIWGLDTTTGAVFQIADKYSIKPTISPDGSLTAHYFMDSDAGGEWRIALLSTKTGQRTGKLGFPATVNDRRMSWHPSGKFIGQAFSSGGNGSLLLMPLDGGSPKMIGELGRGRLNSVDWSKNGETFAYSLLSETSDVVTLSNF
jgi:DNA-binding winged helix-turn-helix (wHTH) protein/Tol biopolymer transport system component